jgi:methyl-accepting chemotaxis protein
MNSTVSRITGIILILTAVAGLVLSTFGVIATWSLKPRVTESLISGVELATNTLETTGTGLDLARDSLKIAISTITALQSTVEATAATFETTTPMLDSIISLSQEDIPNSITAAQSALNSAGKSAEIIDGVLRALTIFSKDLYNPDVPMHIALQQVSESMDSLPGTFETMENSVTDAKSNLETIQTEISQIASDIEEVSSSLEEFDKVISQYQELVVDLQEKFGKLEENLPTYVNFGAVVITVFLLWMAVAQLGLFTQGLDLLRVNSADQTPEDKQPPGSIS